MDTKQKCDEETVCIRCGEKFPTHIILELGNTVIKKQVCDKCSKAEKESREKADTERENLERMHKIRENIEKIPAKYRQLETDKTDLLEKCSKKSVFITGGVGTGKTVFLASLAKRVIKTGETIKWINYSEFIMNLQSQFRVDSENPFETAQKVAQFNGWIFIDDLGAEKLTDYVRQITYYILNEREQWNLPLCITSNYSLADIDELIDKRISSRISGICEAIKFTGADRRTKKVG